MNKNKSNNAEQFVHWCDRRRELDFIVNYDIKYRMGGELEGEE
jgi:hypothetical protein